MERYDYIIAGAGCSGLSLLVHLIRSGKFSDKKILLTDRAPKNLNDHTWCFWEEEAGLFESVVSGRWSQLQVHFPGFSRQFKIAPYQYKMIRADDFYRYCFALIDQQSNIDIRYGNIEALETHASGAVLTLSGVQIKADYIFSSVALKPLVKQPGRHYLLQHFKGWVIETETPAFNPQMATLMDFRIPQTNGTSFIYVLPLTDRKALVEATLFSGEVLPQARYEHMLSDYLATFLPGVVYNVLEEEYGVIPMSNHAYPAAHGRIIYLGTAGGRTKPSTGYTFKPIQAHSAQLTSQLIATGHPYLKPQKHSARFLFYDRTLLQLLANGPLPGAAIFERLFRQNPSQRIFRFLDNATHLTEELQLTLTLQKWPFLKAAFREIFKRG